MDTAWTSIEFPCWRKGPKPKLKARVDDTWWFFSETTNIRISGPLEDFALKKVSYLESPHRRKMK